MRSFSLTVFFLLTLCSISGYARDYHVEVVIFERELAQEESIEQWDFSSDRIAGNRLRIQELADKANIDVISDNRLVYLNRIESELIASGYSILKSARWRQPASVYQNAPLVSLGSQNSHLVAAYIRVYKTSLIFADVDLQLSPANGFEIESNPNQLPTHQDTETVEDNKIQEENFSFSGISQLSEIEKPQNPQYFISEKRRLKFKEIHYLDHPHFGVILGVWPIEEGNTE